MMDYLYLVRIAGMQLKRMPIEPGFWFEWVAFHPQTLVYDGA